MVNIKSNTIFTKIPLITSQDSEDDNDSNKLNYLLEKLHIQKEQTRRDENRREQSKIDANKNPLDEPIISKKDQDLAESGINESTKNIATKKEADTQMVNDLVKMSNRCIISISSQFPWNLFPNTIIVEESRVTFKFNQFFSSQSHSVDIKDISNVFIESSMFFATLQIVSRTFIQNDIRIGNLNKSKAKKVQRIIEGLRTFAEHNINTSNYGVGELISKIEELNTIDNTL